MPNGRCETDHRDYVCKGSFRITYTDGTKGVFRRRPGNHVWPRHFVQTFEPVAVIGISRVEQHDRTIATIASNVGLVAS